MFPGARRWAYALPWLAMRHANRFAPQAVSRKLLGSSDQCVLFNKMPPLKHLALALPCYRQPIALVHCHSDLHDMSCPSPSCYLTLGARGRAQTRPARSQLPISPGTCSPTCPAPSADTGDVWRPGEPPLSALRFHLRVAG